MASWNGIGTANYSTWTRTRRMRKITPDTANAGSSFSIQKPLDHFSRRKVD